MKLKDEFTYRLRVVYNVQVVWQVPNSPDRTMLDLETWMTVQSCVEELHKFLLMDDSILARSMEEAFHSIEEFKVLNIYMIDGSILLT